LAVILASWCIIISSRISLLY